MVASAVLVICAACQWGSSPTRMESSGTTASVAQPTSTVKQSTTQATVTSVQPTTTVATTVPAPVAVTAPPSECDNSTGNRISIPKIKVCASVEVRSGIDHDGDGIDDEVDIPWGNRSAIYEKESRPGQPGFYTISGHVSSATEEGVFFRLGLLNQGDLFTVWWEGSRITYQVTDRQSYCKLCDEKDEEHKGLPYSVAEDAARVGSQLLWVITCDEGSPFHDGHFRDNIVVSALPVLVT